MGAGRGIHLTDYFKKISSKKFRTQMSYRKLKQAFVFLGELCAFVKWKNSQGEVVHEISHMLLQTVN